MNGKRFRLKLVSTLGRGAYGIVYKARDETTGQFVALKEIETEDGELPGFAIREIGVLMKLRHPNVANLLDVIRSPKLQLVFEFMDFDLKELIDGTRGRGMAEAKVRHYMLQMVHGIAYCHKISIIHRDIKPQNILINGKDQLRITDFGMARNIALPLRTLTDRVVTLYYRAPELLSGCTSHGPPIDIWSIGCTFFEMLTAFPLFPGSDEKDQLREINEVLGIPCEDRSGLRTTPRKAPGTPIRASLPFEQNPLESHRIGPEASVLLLSMLTYDPVRRISARQCLDSPYLNATP